MRLRLPDCYPGNRVQVRRVHRGRLGGTGEGGAQHLRQRPSVPDTDLPRPHDPPRPAGRQRIPQPAAGSRGRIQERRHLPHRQRRSELLRTVRRHHKQHFGGTDR